MERQKIDRYCIEQPLERSREYETLSFPFFDRNARRGSITMIVQAEVRQSNCQLRCKAESPRSGCDFESASYQ